MWKRDHKFRREIEWTKIEFSKQVDHVRMNSFKYFSGPKRGPPRDLYSDDTTRWIQWSG